MCRRPAEERFHTALDERSKPCPSVLVCGGRRPWIHSCDTTRHPRVACDAGQPTRACLVKLSTLRYARGSTPPSRRERLSTDPDGRPTPSATKVLRHSESNGYLRAYCEKPGITPPGGRPVFGTATATSQSNGLGAGSAAPRAQDRVAFGGALFADQGVRIPTPAWNHPRWSSTMAWRCRSCHAGAVSVATRGPGIPSGRRPAVTALGQRSRVRLEGQGPLPSDPSLSRVNAVLVFDLQEGKS